MSLYSLLCCPACRSSLSRNAKPDQLRCLGCGQLFPVIDGTPIMLLEPKLATVIHEHELPERPGYARWKERIIIKSLLDSQVVLDFGAGNQSLDDPAIIRMDLALGPHVDVVGDVQALPFKSDSIDFSFGGAVMEHLPRPQLAADEIYRVLRPGGLVYVDWNFIIAYHGYPHHYFNATLNGLRETFRRFTQLEVEVGPFHGAAFALRSVIETYLANFAPQSLLEEEFATHLGRVLWFPLDDFDKRIPPEDRFRVAVSGYLVGVKQPNGDDSIIPTPIRRAWESSAELRRRFPQPLNISVPDNLMAWAKHGAGREQPEIERCLSGLPPFSKRGANVYARPVVDSWPWELMDAVDKPPVPESHRWALWFSRPWRHRLAESWQSAGAAGVARCLWWSLKRSGQQARRRISDFIAIIKARGD